MGELEKFRFDPGKQTRWSKVITEFIRYAQNGRQSAVRPFVHFVLQNDDPAWRLVEADGLA